MFDDFIDFEDEQVSSTKKQAVNISDYIKPSDVPFIPHSIQPHDYQLLIPEGFEDQVMVYLGENNEIIIKMLEPENENYTEVKIRESLYNSEGQETILPKFLYETSSVSKVPVDYLGVNSNQILTACQQIYLLIQHRLTFFRNYSKQFTFLLQKDIKALNDFMEYEPAVAYNTQQKNLNTYVVVPASKHLNEFPFGNFFSVSAKPSEEEWGEFLADVSHYVMPSSDSAMHKRSKIVLAMKSLYRSVGYHHDVKKGMFYSIFEPKQNLAARLKTHLLGEAKRLDKPDISVFQQNCILAEGENGEIQLRSKDATLKRAIVLFSPMDMDTKRFVAGEAEVSANIADTLVINKDAAYVSFTSKEIVEQPDGSFDHFQVKHKVGETVYVENGRRVLLGYDSEHEPVYLNDVISYKITEELMSASGALNKVKYEAVQKAGNARITTDTGLKFVSKVMTEMGSVFMPKPNEDLRIKPKFSPSVSNYLKNADKEDLAKFKKIQTSEFEGMLELKPDVILGMNAVKATSSEQSNSIVLAQAALAVEFGYYKPKLKHGFERLLNTLDEEEINAAAKSLPEFVYVNRFGQREKVLIGIAYLNFTELGSVYTTFKPQSFAFMSGKNISLNCPELNKHIFDNYLEKDMVEIVEEFYKILNDPFAYLAQEPLPKKNPEDPDEFLPSYTVDFIRKKDRDGNMLFTHDKDLILSPVSITNYASSKLLDENWNKGFYINLSKYKNGMRIRIPCAKTLNRFVGTLADGSFSFHSIIINISKMLQNIIGYSATKTNMSLGYLYDNTRKVGTKRPYGKERGKLKTYDLYMDSIQGGLYSNEDAAMMIIQSLIKPKINGLGMKQVVEPLLPDDVIVITDDRKHKRLMKQCYTDEEILMNTAILAETNSQDFDSIVDDVFDNLLIDDMEKSSEEIDQILHDVPYSLAIRDPSLWELQCQPARVWSRQHFALWLSRQPKKMSLDSYLSPKHNRDICLVSSYIALASKSDCDGDRLPVFGLNREGQKIIRKYNLNNVLPEEQAWIDAYIQKEYDSTKKLHIDNPEKHVYKLFKVSCQFDKTGTGNTSNYPQFLFNAMIAKGNIGPATIDMWALYTIFECYQAYCQQNNWEHIVDGKKQGASLQVLTNHEKKKLSFVHVMLVQGNVIEAVKHAEGGSAAFKKYFLDGMTEKDNIEIVRQELIKNYGLNAHEAGKLLSIVHWAKEVKLLTGVKNFITKYNKGKIPEKPAPLEQWEEFIQENSYFGKLMKPIFDIKTKINHLQVESEKEIEAFLKDTSTSSVSSDSEFELPDFNNLFSNNSSNSKDGDDDLGDFLANLPNFN